MTLQDLYLYKFAALSGVANFVGLPASSLQELGFHKSAGVEASLYRKVKPLLLQDLNIRNTADLRVARSLEGRIAKSMTPAEKIYMKNMKNTRRGPFTTVMQSGIDGKVNHKTELAIGNQNSKKGITWVEERNR